MNNKNLYQRIDDCLIDYEGNIFSSDLKEFKVKLKFLFRSYMSLSSRLRVGESGIDSFDRVVSEIERIEIFVLFFKLFSKSILKNNKKLNLRFNVGDLYFIEKIIKIFNDELIDSDIDYFCEKFNFIKFHPSVKLSKVLDGGLEELLIFLSNSSYKTEERNFLKGLREAEERISQAFIEEVAIHKKILIVPLDVVSLYEEFDLDVLRSDVGRFVRKVRFDKRFGANLSSSFIKVKTRSLFSNDSSIPVAKLALNFSFSKGGFKNFIFEFNDFCLKENSSFFVFEPFIKNYADEENSCSALVLSCLNLHQSKNWIDMFLFDRNFCSATTKKFFNFIEI